ncbi:hypothetical protein Sa4125_00130 [Aureimonas sp. SA4125]|nr:hypothetical protein Sa4125_00130 [Aureimonas sp. SA4125]
MSRDRSSSIAGKSGAGSLNSFIGRSLSIGHHYTVLEETVQVARMGDAESDGGRFANNPWQRVSNRFGRIYFAHGPRLVVKRRFDGNRMSMRPHTVATRDLNHAAFQTRQ